MRDMNQHYVLMHLEHIMEVARRSVDEGAPAITISQYNRIAEIVKELRDESNSLGY